MLSDKVKMVIGLILIAIGVIALLIKTGIIAGTIWGYSWPVILIIVGIWFLTRRVGKRTWWYCGWYPKEKEGRYSKREN